MIVQVGSLEFHLIVEGSKWKPHPTRLQSYQKRKKASSQALSCKSDRMPGRVCTRVKHAVIFFNVCVCACWCVYTCACGMWKPKDTIRCPQSLPILFIEAGSLAALKLMDSSNLVT